ncbi:hypothetical protein Tco_0261153 [Tanacetum coccineum]
MEIKYEGLGSDSVLDDRYAVFNRSEYAARIRRIFLDGYGVLVVRTIIFKISSFKLQNARLLVKFHQNELVLEKSISQGYKDAIDGLREEVTQFVGSGVESLVRKLLSGDEFHAALARVAYLGINYGVERGLRMGYTDVEFEATVQKVSNFHVGTKANFDKVLVDFPSTPFLFLSKIAAASGGTLSDVARYC